MAGIKLTMTEQTLLARVLGETMGRAESKLAYWEQQNMPNTVNYEKGVLADVKSVMDKIAGALYLNSPAASQYFVQDFEHHYNHSLDNGNGKVTNA